MSEDARIGFVGAGRMAAGLGAALIRAGRCKPAELVASDPSATARRTWSRATGARTVRSNAEVLRRARTILLAVKPQVLGEVLNGLRNAVTTDHLLISIAAGVRTDQIEARLPAGARVVRVMPNVLCLAGEAASAYCPGKTATAADLRRVADLFNAVGRAYSVPERLMDAVTGLSGCGPAYAAVLIDALADGGVRAGLARDVALVLAAQTLLGTARLILEQGLSPSVVKEMVTSPGGATIAGLHALERGNIRAGLMDAVLAAAQRSRELAG